METVDNEIFQKLSNMKVQQAHKKCLFLSLEKNEWVSELVSTRII